MKQGRSLVDLAMEIQRQSEAKRDFVGNSAGFTMEPDRPAISLPGHEPMELTQHARGQLAAKLDIPMQYFDKLADELPELLAKNVNDLARHKKANMLVRTLDGKVRALLSDRYRPIDNYDLADAILPVIQGSDAVQVQSCNITETKLYIKLLMPSMDRELPVPENLKMGVGHNWFVRRIIGAVVISNSEVGAGMLSIAPGVFEKQCTNLASFKDDSLSRMHLGKRLEGGEGNDVREYLSDATKRKEDEALWAKVRDVMVATMDGRVMDAIVKRLVEARGDVIQGDPNKLVEVFGKKNGLNEEERGGLLKHLANAGEMNRYGLQWAVTRLAQDVESYDRASDLERLGGQVIELPKRDWEVLAKAA